ncbi:MAG: NAD-dependent epimerase/dehydratase family protein [Geminicoccaceae bacterium]
MNILVTGSAGHLGEALMRRLAEAGHWARGVDIKASPFTDHVGSITDRRFVREAMNDTQAVIHSATLHKPHIVTHSRQDFIDTNITGTLNLLEAAVAAGAASFIFTSTTSVFGDALRPPPDEPAAWITEKVQPLPRNIYGATKLAAEDLCRLFQNQHGLNCLVLRTSRFFMEDDDDQSVRDGYADDNIKINEFLYRRVDIDDVASAHLLALERAESLAFDRFIISATTPFQPDDLAELRRDAESVLLRRCPRYESEYRRRGWTMFPTIDRVYVNHHARQSLDWQPRHGFDAIIEHLGNDRDYRSPLARLIGSKGYHDRTFDDGPYPVA